MSSEENTPSWKDRIFHKRQKVKKALQVIEAYKAVFMSENGQSVLEDLAKKCHLMDPVTDISNQNGFSATSAFYDGKRAAFLDIIKMVGFNESQLINLLKQTEGKNDE